MTRPLLTALLYASLALTANPSAAGGIDAGFRAELESLREGDMRKLVFAEAPEPMADIAFETPEGATLHLSDSAGKVRLVNFWATWCAPCRTEKPALDALNRALSGPDFEVIAIATGRNSVEGIKRFNEELGITSLATLLDPGSAAARQAGVLGLPVTILIDREGNEIARLSGGADWSSDSTRAILDRLIAAGR